MRDTMDRVDCCDDMRSVRVCQSVLSDTKFYLENSIGVDQISANEYLWGIIQ